MNKNPRLTQERNVHHEKVDGTLHLLCHGVESCGL